MSKKIICLVVFLGLVLVIGVQARTLFLPPQATNVNLPSPMANPVTASYPMQSFQLKFADASALADTLGEVISEGKVSVNKQYNAIVVRAPQKTIDRVAKIVKELDVAPLQVQVEAKIIEVKSGEGDTNNPSEIGASWKFTRPEDANDYIQSLTTDTLSTAATSIGLYAQLLSGNVNAYLTALEKTIGYDLVASPWITALNHQEASILIGSKYGYKTSIITDTSTVQEVQFLEVGTSLKFVPHINDEGFIIMDIYPSVSEGSVVDDLPQEDTTETRNQVLIRDGQTVVIGGLTKNYNRVVDVGVPFLSQIPVLGAIFRQTSLIAEKRDIMILITPHIITPEFLEEMSAKAAELSERQKEHAQGAKLIH
ncbi:MAG: type II secretion system protein GspD [Candidatus Saganbacteria bacterium]|nr:type II secretion system protein GspD [Candidatus Saganbacteria bacterium]